MTNGEKFKEVFGFYADNATCVAPVKICHQLQGECNNCPFKDWWDKEYKPCFQMLEGLDENK